MHQATSTSELDPPAEQRIILTHVTGPDSFLEVIKMTLLFGPSPTFGELLQWLRWL